MYKATSIFLLVIVFLFSLAGCQESRVGNLQKRLDVFRNTLPQELRAEFDSKNYEKVVKGIDLLLQVDENFIARYEQLKRKELIDLFTSQEVVDFFKTYFVEEIEKEKIGER